MLDRIVALVSFRLRQKIRSNKTPASGAFFGALLTIFAYLVVNPGGEGAYFYGKLLRSGELEQATAGTTTGVGVLGLILFAVALFRSLTKSTKFLDTHAFAAVNVGRNTHVSGIILYELCAFGFLIAVPVLSGAAAFALGARSPLIMISMLIAAGSLLATVIFISYPLGLALNYPVQRYEFPTKLKYLLGAAAFVALEAVFVYREALVPYVTRPPFTWYADFALAFVPGVRVPPLAVLSVVTVPVILFFISTALSVQLVDVVWFNEGPALLQTEDDSDQESVRTSSLLFAIGSKKLPSRLLTIGDLSLRRSLRSPYATGQVLLTLALIGLLGLQSMQGGSLSPQYTVSTAVLLPVAVGSLSFTLNPLGSDSDALPHLLTTSLSDREYLLGKVVVSLVLGLPLAILTTAAAIYYTPSLSLTESALLVTMCMVLSVVSPFIAVLCGMYFPKIEQAEIIRGASVSLPTRRATVLFAASMTLLYLPGGGSILSAHLGGAASLSVAELLSGVGVTIVAGIIAAHVSYRQAIHRLSKFSIDGTATNETSLTDVAPPRSEHTSTKGEASSVQATVRTVVSAVSCTAFLVVLSTFVALLVTLILGPDTVQYQPVSAVISAISAGLVTVGYLVIYERKNTRPEIRRPSVDDVPFLIIGVTGLIAVQLAVQAVVSSVGVSVSGNTVQSLSDETILHMLFVSVLLAGPAEELLFRRVIQRRLSNRFNSLLSVAGASILFTIPHVPNVISYSLGGIVVSLSQVFAGSLLLGVVFAYRKDITTNILIHSGFNFAVYASSYMSFYAILPGLG